MPRPTKRKSRLLRRPHQACDDARPAQAPQTRGCDQGETEITPVKKKVTTAGRHTVANGETLYSLGRKYGVSPFVIADANGLDHNTGLQVGQQLRIPGGATQRQAAVVSSSMNRTSQPSPGL